MRVSSVVAMEEIYDLKLDGLLDPCGNCRDLLRQARANVWRFRTDLVDRGPMSLVKNLFWVMTEGANPANLWRV